MELDLPRQRLLGNGRFDAGTDGGGQNTGSARIEVHRSHGKACPAEARTNRRLVRAGAGDGLRDQRQQFVGALITVMQVVFLEALKLQQHEYPGENVALGAKQALQLVLQAAAVVQARDRIAVGFALQLFRARRFVFDEMSDFSRQAVHGGDHPSQFARFWRERNRPEIAFADGRCRVLDLGQRPQYFGKESAQRDEGERVDQQHHCQGLQAGVPQLQVAEIRMAGDQHAPELAPARTDQRFGSGRA